MLQHPTFADLIYICLVACTRVQSHVCITISAGFMAELDGRTADTRHLQQDSSNVQLVAGLYN